MPNGIPQSRQPRALATAAWPAWKSDLAFVALCLLLGAFLRLLHIADYAQLPIFSFPIGPDVSEYEDWAKSILAGIPLWTELKIHSPLYAYFLAGLHKAFGSDMHLIRFTQTALNLLAGIPVFLLLRDVCASERSLKHFAPHLFIVIWALYPPAIQYQSELYSESLLVPLLACAVYLMHRASRCEGGAEAALAAGGGLLTGLAICTHPATVFFAGLEALLLAARAWGPLKPFEASARRAAPLLAFALAAALPVLPVCLYNSHLAGAPVFIQGNSGFNLYLGNNPSANGTCYLRPGPEWEACHNWAQQESAKLGISKDAFFVRDAFGYVLRHPLDWAALMGRKALYALNAKELLSSTELSVLGLTFIHQKLWNCLGIFTALALLGLWLESCGPGRGWRLRHLTALLLAFWLAQTLFVPSGRYRLPMYAGIFAFAALAVCALPGILKDKARRLKALAVFALALGIVFLPSPPRDLARERAEADSAYGEACLAAGALKDAEAHLERARQGLAHWDRASNMLGKLRRMLGDEKGAERIFEEAIQSFPDSPYAFMNFGTVRASQGSLEEAERLFKEAERRKPDLPENLYNEGLLAQRKGELSKAAELYAKCLSLNPIYREALNNLGALRLMSGQPAKAKELFERAIALETGNAGLRVNLAIALKELGDRAGAKASLEKALKLQPSNATAKSLLEKL